MSIKNDIDMVKEELNSEEKFFEKAVVTEKFVKKYKKPMIGALVAIVLVVGANIAYDLKEQNRISSANDMLAKLQANPLDTNSLNELKSLSPKLHDAWILSRAIVDNDTKELESLKNSKAELVQDVASYELAQAKKDVKLLDSYSAKDSAIYKDLALVQSAIILMNEGKIDQAHRKLSYVSSTSNLSQISTALLHYGVK